MSKIPLLTCTELETIATQMNATPADPLRFHSGCGPDTGLVGLFVPGTSVVELRCTECDGIAAKFAIAQATPKPEPAPLVQVGRWQSDEISEQDSDMTAHAVQTHMQALQSLPELVRNNVVGSILASFLLTFADPLRELETVANQMRERLPGAIKQRELMRARPVGNG